MDNNLKELSVADPKDYSRVANLIQRNAFEGLHRLNIAILSSYTSEIIKPFLTVELGKRGFLSEFYFGPFNQFEQEIFARRSGLYSFNPDIIFIDCRLEEAHPGIFDRFCTLSGKCLQQILISIEERVQQLLDGVRRHSDKPILLANFTYPEQLAFGLGDPCLDVPQASFVQEANDRLSRLVRCMGGCYIVDKARQMLVVGTQNWVSEKLTATARVPFSVTAQIAFSQNLARYITAIFRTPCKCLVLDLDNTLWGGILGEDGLDGLHLGDEYPGIAFKKVQKTALNLMDRGVLLALASKNDRDEALAALENHSECEIKPSDFSAIQIHWDDKATSIRKIAEELNIGLDSIAFFDDSPVEREWVKTQLPQVNVIDVPKSPLLYSSALLESELFDSLTLTREDKKRTELYRNEKERKNLHRESPTLEEFIAKLQIVARFGYFNEVTAARIAQLIKKVNQFNVTTKRHELSDLKKLIKDGGVILWMQVEDRFGDNGLVGVGILTPKQDGDWLIDTLLLSCRVLGRHLESAFLNVLANEAREQGADRLIVEFHPTAKNAIMANFFSQHSFKEIDGLDNSWYYDLSESTIPQPSNIKVRFESE